MLTDADPCAEIDRLIQTCWAEKLPVYLAEATGMPYAVVYAGKSAFVDESRPLWLGGYLGTIKGDPVSDRIDGADVLLRLGLPRTSTNQGAGDVARHPAHVVDLGVDAARIGSKHYPGVALADVVDRIAERLPGRSTEPERARFAVGPFTVRPDTPITQDRLPERLATFFEDGDLVVLDQGTCSAVRNVRLPAGAGLISRFSWGAIGVAVPTAVGTLMAAPDRRQVVVTGDGGFQLSAQELSTVLRYGASPILAVLNNGAMAIEDVSNPGLPPQRYNELQPWEYAKLPAVLAPQADAEGFRVTTEAELDAALVDAAKVQGEGRCAVIDVVLGPTDVSASIMHTLTSLVDDDLAASARL